MTITIPHLPITRGQLNKVFTVVLLFNSIAAIGSVVIFFLSSWWVFLLLGTIGFPVLAGGFLLYRYTSYKAPMQKYAINFVRKIYEGIVQRRESLMRRMYTTVCWFLPTEEWKHVYWGYASLSSSGETMPIDETLEDKRFYCQLYNYLATGMGNWNTLEGKNIVEFRSGGGGGLNFLAETLSPQKAIGIETSSTQVQFCNKAFSENPKLKFYTADTLEALSNVPQLVDERIDIAISLQSSIYIKDFKKFIQEVDSILKPGGVFAFADLRLLQDWPQLESDLTSSSMKILKKENISNNVIQALELDDKGKWQLIYRRLGSMVRRGLKAFGLIKNNAVAASLKSGTNTAMAYLLHKLPEPRAQWAY